MSVLQPQMAPEGHRDSRSAPCPVTAPDGRPFVKHDDGPGREDEDPDLDTYWPWPPQEGDPVYCCGIVVGTFHGTYGEGGNVVNWTIHSVPTKDMPEKYGRYVRHKMQQYSTFLKHGRDGIRKGVEMAAALIEKMVDSSEGGEVMRDLARRVRELAPQERSA